MHRSIALCLALASCSASPDPPDPLEALHASIAELEARPEHDAKVVEVQHILVSFAGAPRMPATVSRSKEEAEVLAADLLARIEAGEDFDTLVTQYTDDRPPGIYAMSTDGSTTIPRTGMVPAFGDVGWRLEVGEVGVAPHDAQRSPFGWHIVKRRR